MHNPKIPIPVLKLPTTLRSYFAYPHGTLIISEKAGKLFTCNIRGDYLVGDVVSQKFRGDIRIIDFKTRRTKKYEHSDVDLSNSILIINPQGTVSQNSRTLTILKKKKYMVYGEEDLLTMSISLTNEKKIIIYGYPGYGAVITCSDTVKARRLLKRFKPDIVFLNKVSTGTIMRDKQNKIGG